MEWHLGIFTLMAVMIAIIGGGTGIRLMYVDVEYRKIIKSTMYLLDEKSKTKMSTELRVYNQEKLANMRGKWNRNRYGVRVDGACIFLILFVGFTTALGHIPNMTASILIAMMVFGISMVPFYYHVQNVLKQPL